MKTKINLYKVALLLLATITVAGCATGPTSEEIAAEAKAEEIAAEAKAEEIAAEAKAAEERRIAALDEYWNNIAIAKAKAAEERRIARIAEAKAAEERRVATCDEYWNNIANVIKDKRLYDSREEILNGFKSNLLHNNNDGLVILEDFASEYMPNTFAKYEKAREKSLEVGQNLKEVFKEKLDNTKPLWVSYVKATEKYAGILVEELRLQNDITYHYLLFKVGALSQERLNEIDSKKVCIYLEQPYTYTLDSKVEKIDGVMEFASKHMPETHYLLETFEKEIGETKVQYDSIVSDAEKMSFFKKNSTHPTLVALHYKYKVLASRYNELMQEVSNLQIKHMLLECTGEDLANKDAELGKKHKEFKDSLPDYVKVGSLNRRSLDINDLISSMVKIPGRDYFMQSTEVTQIQWSLFMKNNSEHKGRMLPVEYVSWDDCQEFIKKLNETEEVKKAGLTFRLPTHEEWQYACRAGSTGKYGLIAGGLEGTLDEMGWYYRNSGETHPVAQKIPNAWGLYDMHGNVWEWTASAHNDDRIFCGGSFNRNDSGWGVGRWYGDDYLCEVDYWYDGYQSYRCCNLGFRLAASRTEK